MGSPTGTPEQGPDPFGTASIREAVLRGWEASPARFREDANAEEDAALGAYRDRLIVELLQNAADAAVEAGVRSQVRIRLTTEVLEVANTGAALTAAGVSALATLRASAKRTAGSVGRFGVGFAAVLSVTSAPEIVSRSGGVRWSKDLTCSQAAAVPALSAELARRQGAVPTLRLPYPVTGEPPPGFDTVVRLPLAPDGLATARRLLAAFDPSLLLVLPAVAQVSIEDGTSGPEVRRFSCEWTGDDALLNGELWRGARRHGTLDASLLAGRGVEERERDTYEVRVFVPESDWPEGVPRVVRAPQPTDEPLSLPALVIASLPVDPGRRRVVPGPLTDTLIAEVAAAVVDLAERTGDLRLVPTGLPAGPLDAAIADCVVERLPDARVLPGKRRGADAVLLDLGPASDAISDLLRDDLPGLLPAALTGPRWAAARRVLGVRELGAGELMTLLAGLFRPPRWWARLYPALAQIADRDALAALPVPLADGRTVTGPRGVLLPAPNLDATLVAELPLRLAHPAVATGGAGELLRSLGAVDANPAVLLADPSITGDGSELDSPVPYEAVLALVAALGPSFDAVPADLGDRLLLPGDDGELWAAGELLLPGGELAAVALPDAPFGTLAGEVASRYPPDVLAAAGVLATFSVVRAFDVLLDPDEPVLLELDGSDEWLGELPPDAEPVVREFRAIRDLELVRFPEALPILAGPHLRAAVLASPYTCWWLANHPVMPGGLLPTETALGDELGGLYDPPAEGLDPEFLTAIGVRTTVAAMRDPADLYDLLDRLGAESRDVAWPRARRLYVAVAKQLDEPTDEPPPEFVRTPAGVVPREQAAVVDRPDLLPLLGKRAPLRVPANLAAGVARMLGVPLASTLASFEVLSESPLTVRDADGRPQRVRWFGQLHDGTPEGRARALAWAQARWNERHAIAAALRDPAERDDLDAEADLEPEP